MRNLALILSSLLAPLSLGAAPVHEYLGQKDGLSSNHVNCVMQDNRGFLWIGTDAGLDLYDGETVQTFPRPVLSLAEAGGLVWAGTPEGIYTYDPAVGRLSPFRTTTRYGVNIVSRVNTLTAAGQNLLYAGTQGQGLFLYNTATDELVQHSIHTPYVKRIVKGPEGRLLVESMDGSVALFSADGSFLRNTDLRIPPKEDTLKDREGTLWIPTRDNGLLKIPGKDAGTVSIPFPDDGAADAPARLAEDRDGNLWLGTGKHLFILPDGADRIEPVAAGLRLRGTITGLLASPGHLWIGTDADGLYRYSPATHQMKHYPLDATINALHRLEGGEILVGTDLGVFSYHSGNDNFEPELNRKDIRIILDGNALSDNHLIEFEVVAKSSITAFAEDRSYHLYMATSNRGIFRKDLISGNWEHLVNTRTGDGYLPGNKVTLLFPGKDGGIWAGTSGEGLWYLPKDSLSFSRILLPDRRLDGARITSLATDGGGLLWMSTNLGIWCYDPSGHSITPYNIHPGELLYSTGGRLFVGQNDALVSMTPDEGPGRRPEPRVVIREMTVGDSTIFIPPGGRDIVLKYAQNSFSIRLAELGYSEPSKKLYSWRLRGFEKSMTKGGSQNIATYTKIPHGDYVFEAEGADDVLHITVRPPWWSTPLARIAWILLAVGAVASALVLYQRTIQHRYSRMMKEREEAREKELYEQRIRFFIGLVHEIRTPLTLIRLQHDREQHEPGDVISRNLDYMQETINRILSYDKNTADGIDMLITRVDLCAFAASVTSNFRESARAKGIRTETAFPESPVWVQADEDHLTKILNNLLSNALKYARDTIRVGISTDGGQALLSVEDNGPGVKDEEKEKIFGIFYTPADDKVAQASGMGVGLAYALQIAKAHGGTIRVGDSSLGGASFTLRLPLLQEGTASAAAAAWEGPSTDASDTCVLIVEDNTDLLETVRGDLSSYYRILTATDGAKALKVLEEQEVDVVVSDVMMPVMDGLELCRTIKGNLAYSHIPVILLTAKVSLPDKTEGMDSGADAYVEKPFSLRQLHGQIDNLLRLREAFRQALSKGADLPEESRSGPDADFMKAINASIENQIAEESFSIEALAYDMAMSRTNFFRKFKALTGSTPNDYLKHYRLQRAAELIRDGARINEAAEKVGFTSSSYFAKCFKQRFGVLPKDYAKAPDSRQARNPSPSPRPSCPTDPIGHLERTTHEKDSRSSRE